MTGRRGVVVVGGLREVKVGLVSGVDEAGGEQ
jgi:hypothetical protein